MRGRRTPPWASLPKRTPAPRRRQSAWWEYALTCIAAVLTGMVKGAAQASKRTPTGERAAFAPPLRRRRCWW
jgi:hypothetical protein